MNIVILCIIITIIILGKKYFNGPLCSLTGRLDNKIIMITGATAGIGKSLAMQLLDRGATLLVVGRSKPTYQAQYFHVDLSDFDSIRRCAKEICSKVPRIDIIINNAAIMGTLKRELTNTGIELQFGTNYIGHFLLTELLVLLNVYQITKLIPNQSRLINVSSVAHTYQDLNLSDINLNRWANSILWSRYYTYRAYGNSKFALLMHAQEFSNRHNITAISVHPGIVRTNILRHQLKSLWARWLLWCFWPIFWYFTKSPYHGAQTILQCVLDKQLIDGAYYSDCAIGKSYYTNSDKSKKLWDFTQELISQH